MNKVLDSIFSRIEAAQKNNRKLLLVIDGKCGSGKTTLSERLGECYGCNVFHIDDFYLPIIMQTPEIMKEPGGNINYDRFIAEIMEPLTEDRELVYRPFLCMEQEYAPGVSLKKTAVNVIEGTYSCHPRLRKIYASMMDWEVITLFLDIDDKNQRDRVRGRVGEQRFKLFEDKWIPREREYFRAYSVGEYCDYSVFGADNTIKEKGVHKMQIRRAEEKDIERISELLAQVLEIHAGIRPDIFISGTTKYTYDELCGMIKDDNKPIYVAVNEQDRVLGYAFCAIKNQPFSNNMVPFKSLFIDDLCVDADTRGMHVGSALFEFAKEEAKRLGCYELTLNVWEGNDSARHFYEKMGMKPKETQMEYILR